MAESAGAFDDRHRLSGILEGLGIHPTPALMERLWLFTSLLLKWNRIYNLTGARDEATLVREHLIDSLATVPLLSARIGSDVARGSLLVDVGSGAGFPGIVIAAVHPDWRIALIEPIGKKAAFLRQAIATLGLGQAHPFAERLQASESALTALNPTPGTTRHFTCRAVAPLPDLVELIRPLARPGSRLFALKSRHLDEELAEFSNASVHSLLIPTLGQERTVVELPLSESELSPPDRPLPSR